MKKTSDKRSTELKEVTYGVLEAPLVRVVWMDAAAGADWTEESELKHFKPHKIETIGFLLRSDSDGVLLCATRDHEQSQTPCANNILVVPTNFIIDVVPLSVVAAEKATRKRGRPRKEKQG